MKKKEVITLLKTTYVADARERRNAQSEKFIKDNQAAFDNTEISLNQSLNLLINVVTDATFYQDDFKNSDCVAMLDNAISTAISCIDLAKQLKFMEMFIISRNVIELCASAYAIKNKQGEHDKFEGNSKHQFDSTLNIQFLKREIPKVGILYGDISSRFSHVHPVIHGAKKYKVKDGIVAEHSFRTFHIEPPPDFGFEVLTLYLKILSNIVLATTELIFLEKTLVSPEQEVYFLPDKKTYLLHRSGLNIINSQIDEIINIATKMNKAGLH